MLLYSACTLTTRYELPLLHAVLCWRCSVVRVHVIGVLLAVGDTKHQPIHISSSVFMMDYQLAIDHSLIPHTVYLHPSFQTKTICVKYEPYMQLTVRSQRETDGKRKVGWASMRTGW